MNKKQVIDMQERMTEEAAESINEILQKRGLTYTQMPQEMKDMVLEIYEEGCINTIKEIKRDEK